ncbi:MAG TPA: SurA N-terminal domain-containing protein [Egibacteraceae bacterium]|nr:SurA N-terminal domain-containing protein [Egibacteraceae bacterium]
MRMLSRLVAVALLAFLLVACGGDGGEGDETAQRPDPTPDAAPGADLPDGVAAVVNGQEISAQDIDGQIAAFSENAQIAEAMQGAEGEQTLALLKAQVLSTTIVNLIAIECAEELGVPVTDEDIAQARAELEEDVGGSQALDEAVAREGMPAGHLAAQLRALAALRNIEEALTEAAGDEAQEAPPPEPGAPTAAEARAQRFVRDKLLEADVVINDDYGTWDAETGRIIPPGGVPKAPEQPPSQPSS